ncbi:MAG: aspartate--tRNA ligase [Clostridiales bacterium]|nr:aspartate--tRNA ligase [Clostridiales bacterium]
MAEFLNGWQRTEYCAEPNSEQVGKEVLLMGWASTWRNLGALIFIGLRDRTGIMQLVFDSGTLSAEKFEHAESIRSEYVLAVKGILQERSKDMVNPEMKTGKFEVIVSDFKILSTSQTPPIYIKDDLDAAEQMRLKYRYLDLRRPVMQNIFALRHKIAMIAREYFSNNGFLEIETPMLTKSTPEGARDYLVPSRIHKGEFYALPQSPQLFKQLLMLSGFDRYIQLARCFRDEDLRADRQPEFTQIDLEMSFVDENEIISLNEGFIKKLFKDTLDIDVKLPLQRITFKEAMERYGSDKPDTRFSLELKDVSDIVADCGFGVFTGAIGSGGSVRAIKVEGGVSAFSRKAIDELVEFVKTYGAKGLAWMSLKPEGLQCAFAKFLSQEQIDGIIARMEAQTDDLLLFVADKDDTVFAALGALRIEIAKKLNLIDENVYHILWVTDFPLLEWDDEQERFSAMHHPFTSPKDEDLQYLESDPGRVRAKAYDIVINGYEAGGGSIRIHSQELQEKMFSALGFTTEQAWAQFGFLLEAFKYGTPPHGGIAYGLDRLVMLIAKTNNIRDVIAFPKVQTAACLMTKAPSTVDKKQLDELGIAVVADKEE